MENEKIVTMFNQVTIQSETFELFEFENEMIPDLNESDIIVNILEEVKDNA